MVWTFRKLGYRSFQLDGKCCAGDAHWPIYRRRSTAISHMDTNTPKSGKPQLGRGLGDLLGRMQANPNRPSTSLPPVAPAGASDQSMVQIANQPPPSHAPERKLKASRRHSTETLIKRFRIATARLLGERQQLEGRIARINEALLATRTKAGTEQN